MAEATGAVWALSDTDLTGSLISMWAEEQALAARRLAVVQETRGRDLARRHGATSLTSWLCEVLRISGGEARRMIELATALEGPCTATATALAKGVVNTSQAAVITKAVTKLKDYGAEIQQQAEAILLADHCTTLEPVPLAKAAAHVLEHVAPELAEAKLRKDLEDAEKLAARDRALSWTAYGDGTGRHRLAGVFGAEDTATIKAAIGALTQPAGQDDTRTAAQRAADALTDLCRFTLASGDLPEDGGDAAAVVVTMNLADLSAALHAGMLAPGAETLAAGAGIPPAGAGMLDAGAGMLDTGAGTFAPGAGMSAAGAGLLDTGAWTPAAWAGMPPTGAGMLDTRAGMSFTGAGPPAAGANTLDTGTGMYAGAGMFGAGVGMLDSGHPILPGAVRRLACCAKIIPAVLGERSVPIDLGRARRLFTGAARRALVLRDKGCAFPGCDRPPKWCEGHHVISWLDGGPTDLANGLLLCGHHHRVIHHSEWTVRIAADGHPEFLPPFWLDPLQTPRRNTYWHRA